MGANRLDGISRALAGGLSRRQALRQIGLVIAGGGGVALMEPAGASAAAPSKCPKTQTQCCICVSATSDPNNCGACGHVCSFPNATAMCVNSTCQIGSCNPGFANCNGVASDGCEVNLNTDPNNCGTCGHVCPSGGSCLNGTCAGGPGAICGTNSQCASGICSGGFCCTTACVAGTGGVCGFTGACTDTGVCALAPTTTVCTTPTCSATGQVFTASGNCDGTGKCLPGSSTDCAASGMVCNATVGCVQCNTNTDCPTGQTCSATHTCS